MAAKTETLQDNFPGSSLNTALWNGSYGTVVVANGQAILSCTSTYSGIATSTTYDLTNSHMSAKVVGPSEPGNGTKEIIFKLEIDPNNQILMFQSGSSDLQFRVTKAGVNTQSSIAYNPSSMAFWSIREAAGTVYFQTSPDGNNWTIQAQQVHGLNLTAVTVNIGTGFFGTETNDVAIISNVNIVLPAPAAPVIKTNYTGRASKRFEDAMDKSNRWVVDIQYTNDGTNWLPLQYISGTVTRDMTQQVHWQADITCVLDDNLDNWNSRIQIKYGLWYSRYEQELLPFGYYIVNDTINYDRQAKTMELSLCSIEQLIIDETFDTPTTIATNSADGMIKDVLDDIFSTYEYDPVSQANIAVPAYALAWDEATGQKMYTPMPSIPGATSRWDVIDGQEDSPSVAKAVSCRFIADADGCAFTMLPIPQVTDAPVMEINTGEALVTRQDSFDNSNIYNKIIASGQNVNGTTFGPIILTDQNPLSPTQYSQGLATSGRNRTLTYTSPMITSAVQLQELAQTQLGMHVGAALSVTFTSTNRMLLVPGDTISIDGSNLLIDAIEYDLTGSISCTVRAQTKDLSGILIDVVDDADSSDSGDDDGSSSDSN